MAFLWYGRSGKPNSIGRSFRSRAASSTSVEHFRREGASRVVMSTLPRMRSAHRIYERAGFVRLPERDWSPAEGIDLITYVLELGQS